MNSSIRQDIRVILLDQLRYYITLDIVVNLIIKTMADETAARTLAIDDQEIWVKRPNIFVLNLSLLNYETLSKSK